MQTRWVNMVPLLMFMVLSGTSNGLGASFVFTKVADTTTAVPGGAGTFGGFDSPAIDNGNVAFRAQQFLPATPRLGFYKNIGSGLTLVVDTETPIPSGVGNFLFVNRLSLDQENVAFSGTSNVGNQSGIYTDSNGVLTVVADTATTIPGGTGNFIGVSSPSFDQGDVAFLGGSSSQQGIYANIGGVLDVVVDTTTPIPSGIGTFSSIGAPSLDNSSVAFRGNDATQVGLYTNLGGVLTVIADQNIPIPGGTGNFANFNAASLHNGLVAFGGQGGGGQGQRGIYLWDLSGNFTVVADINTPVPSGTGNFVNVGDPILDHGHVVFMGNMTTGQRGG